MGQFLPHNFIKGEMKMYDYPQTNKKLKAKIVEHFGTQRLFAFKMQTDSSFVSKVVRGYRILDPERQALWAEALGCEVDEIFLAETARRTYQ
jgi:transcriptional regulator with XRE-family HTH domain